MRASLFVCVALVASFCCVVNAAPIRYEFATTFTSTPVNGVNHAIAHSAQLSSNFTSDGVSFSSTAQYGGVPMVWTSKTLNVAGDTWAEIGTLTLVGETGNSTLNFKSFGRVQSS
eukprot:TRINITY_DN7946_c2_g1_i1.p2 TRINITY_DN7946_c2_g1~~TRINITY_DN7946_c2_g1_i1.p2  ORF type:complete len:126 (+),score=12.31 TRINITY_DN7946_c2_g1_i1:35-379(+)